MRKASDWIVYRERRPLSRGVRYVLENLRTSATMTAYSAREMRAIRDELLAPPGGHGMPGARAAIVRPARRYL